MDIQKIDDTTFSRTIPVPDIIEVTPIADVIRDRDFHQGKVEELNALILKAKEVGVEPVENTVEQVVV